MNEVADKPRAKRNNQGRLLKAMRHYKGKTQEQVARDLNMSQSRIFEFEIMDTIPDDALEKLAGYFNVSVDFLKNFDLEDAAKNYTYNNNANNSDHAQEFSANENLIINNPDQIKELKEAYEKVAELNKVLGAKEAEIEFLKSKK